MSKPHPRTRVTPEPRTTPDLERLATALANLVAARISESHKTDTQDQVISGSEAEEPRS